jgi:CO/xanthine dehydrogenase Mo-binding subunit
VRGLFIDNIFLKEMLFMRTLRSPVRYGRLLSIDCPVLPEGYRLIRASDIPGRNYLPGPDADPAFSHPILAESTLLYEGQPVALLVGPDIEVLAKLEAAILVNAEEADAPERVYAERHITVEAKGRPSRTPKNAGEEPPEQTRLVETYHRTPSAEHNAPECTGAVAFFEGTRCVIHTASQWPRHVQHAVAGALNIDEANVVIGRESQGVHFDGKLWYPSLIAAQAALAASIVKTPVKFMLTRREERLYAPSRAPSEIKICSTVSESGRILDTNIAITADMGACGFFADEIIDRMALAALGLYRLGTVNIQAKAIGTASAPKGAFAGFGMAQGFFAIERHLMRVTDDLHVSPLHWKGERNMAKESGAAVRLPIGITVKKPLAIRELVGAVCTQSDFGRKWAAYDLLRRKENTASVFTGHQRGIGLAFAYQGAGLLYHAGSDPLPHVTAIIEDNELVLKCAASKEIGTNIINIWKKIALNAVRSVESVRYDDSGSGWGDDPAVLSRDIAYITGLVAEAAQDIAAQGIAAQNVAAQSDAALPGTSDVPNNRSTAYYQSHDIQNWAGKTCDPKAFASPSLCAAVVEVEVDRVEYKPIVRGIRLCVEGGKILSMAEARNTLVVSSIAALAWAQGKHEVPNIKDVPNIEVDFIACDKTKTGKGPDNQEPPDNDADDNEHIAGLEELAFSTIPAAYAAAVSQALNISFDSIPIRALEIWQALNPKTESKGGEE